MLNFDNQRRTVFMFLYSHHLKKLVHGLKWFLMQITYFDQYESVELGYGGDTVLHLILCHLYQGAVGLLVHHGIHSIPRHPGMYLILTWKEFAWIVLCVTFISWSIIRSSGFFTNIVFRSSISSEEISADSGIWNWIEEVTLFLSKLFFANKCLWLNGYCML